MSDWIEREIERRQQRGRGRGLSPDQHEAVNARHYPGTRQLCVECDQPTGRCEEDSILIGDLGPLCEECAERYQDRCQDCGATVDGDGYSTDAEACLYCRAD